MNFIVLIAVVMSFGAWFVFKKPQNIAYALIFQITPFLSVNVLEHSWTKVSPEPILLAITLGYSLFILSYLFRKSQKTLFLILSFGIMGGLGLATKPTFLPVLIIPFFFLPGWKNKSYYFLVTVASFFLFTSPAHTEYKHMYNWFLGLILHKGIYGHGDPGLVDLSSFLNNMVTIFRINIFFSLSFLLSLVFIIWRSIKRHRTNKRAFIILIALVTVQAFSVLLVAKHYANHNHYLMPALALNGFTWIILMLNVKELMRDRVYRMLAPTFLLLTILWFIILSIPALKYKNKGYAYTNSEYEKAQQILKEDYSSALIIYHYPDGFNAQSALKFGNAYSKLTNQNNLNEVYPKTYFFNTIQNTFQYWETEVSVEEMRKQQEGSWVITGRPLDEEAFKTLNDFRLSFKEVYRGIIQSIYVLDSTAQLNSPAK